ncbi:MAG: cupin domain-containing protein [Saprospiraceae bacterium]
MPIIHLNDVEVKELLSGFDAQLIHTEQMTLGYFDIKAGSILPEQSHVHEQVSNILEGQFEMVIDGNAEVLTKGMVAVIPSMVRHGGRALTDCKILDVFCPPREDYK